MAKKTTTIKPSGSYFFLENRLYRKEKLLIGDNSLVAVECKTGERKYYVWTTIKYKIEKCWNTPSVAQLMGKSVVAVRGAVASQKVKVTGVVPDKDVPTLVSKYFWSQSDILALHDYFLKYETKKRKNSDPLWGQKRTLPARPELVQMMDTGVITDRYNPAFAAQDQPL